MSTTASRPQPRMCGRSRECAGSPQFTHISFDDFRVIRDNLAGGRRTMEGRLVPYCMFIDPPVVRVGTNEREARERGVRVRVTKLPMTSVLRTRTTSETTGFMKAFVGDDDCIVGFVMIGSDAGRCSPIQIAMMARLPYTTIRDAVLTHPTMAEGLNGFCSATCRVTHGNVDMTRVVAEVERGQVESL